MPDPTGAAVSAPRASGGDLRKVQTSKNPYKAMARIRSAGELVVGLDQNNLPFSSAHPSPPGLDHEIAGLLAERLGVSLRVYWAVSAHDSYPSKLASKGLCDVILGVMPDDRFAGRVLYSRPYQVARYRVVVRSGEGRPEASVPIAVEQGVAVRGLDGRATHDYPSTEAVLEAVATGRERAGYVIATRGAWLAHERWPGKLELLPAPGADGRHRRLPDRRGGAEVGPRAEGRHRPRLGRARPLGPAGPGVRAVAYPLRARPTRRGGDGPGSDLGDRSSVARSATYAERGRWLLAAGRHGGLGRDAARRRRPGSAEGRTGQARGRRSDRRWPRARRCSAGCAAAATAAPDAAARAPT